MARKIFVASDMGIDDRLAEIADTDPMAALLWPWLLTVFDDWGRADASPRRIKGAAFGSLDAITATVIANAIEKFIAAGLLQSYAVDGREYIAVPAAKWFDYQTHIHTGKREDDSKSKVPAPPSWGNWIAAQRLNSTDKCAINSDDTNTIAESRGKSRNHAENRASPSPSPSPTPTVTVTPTVAVTRGREGAAIATTLLAAATSLQIEKINELREELGITGKIPKLQNEASALISELVSMRRARDAPTNSQRRLSPAEQRLEESRQQTKADLEREFAAIDAMYANGQRTDLSLLEPKR